MNRDPSNLSPVIAAVAAWLTYPGDDQGDRNNHMIMVLVEGGVLTPDEASACYVEPGAAEHDVVDCFLEDGSIVRVHGDATVEVY